MTDLQMKDLLQDADEKNRKMQEDFREIANYTDAVENVLQDLMADTSEWLLVRLTLDKIIEIAKEHF